MGRHAADRTAPGSPGIAQAFHRLVEPHRAALRAYVLRLAEGDEAAADSILKETLYRLAQDPRRYPHDPSAVRPWLMLTARTVLHDGERHAPAGHDDRPDTLPQGPRPPRPMAPAATIVAMMKDLSDADRALILDLVYGEVSLEAAAADRGVPVETIKFRLHVAMRALRAALDQHVADRRGVRW